MKHYKTLLLDVVFLFILSAFSLFLISFYFDANYIETGYWDWLVHAYRVKLLDEIGFTSWIHSWSNGISVWKAYQFVPHYITLAVSRIFSVEITRAMVLITIAQFVLLRSLIYVVLRVLKISPFVAFVTSIISFDIAQYWMGVNEYSLLFAYTLSPVIFLCWVNYLKNKSYWFPFIGGIGFIVHPMLGIVSGLLLMVSILVSDRWSALKTIAKILIFLGSSFIFWYPVLMESTYRYSNIVYETKNYINLPLQKFGYFGLSFYIFLLVVMGVIFLPKYSLKYRWLKPSLFFCVFFLMLTIVGANIELPSVVYKLQFTRALPIIGIFLLLTLSPFLHFVFKLKSLYIKGIVVFISTMCLVEGIWFSSLYSEPSTQASGDLVATYIERQVGFNANGHRFWTPYIDNTSFFGSINFMMASSYMTHLELNQFSPRLRGLLWEDNAANYAKIDTILSYLKLGGVKYVFLEPSSNFIVPFQQSMFFNETAGTEEDIVLFELQTDVRDATLVHANAILAPFDRQLHPDSMQDQNVLDKKIADLTRYVYDKENETLPVVYPDPETISITVPSNRNKSLVFINSSFDTGWNAYFNGRKQKIQTSGPNFMLVELDRQDEGGVLLLKHTWPLWWFVSVVLALLIFIVLSVRSFYLFFRKRHAASHKN